MKFTDNSSELGSYEYDKNYLSNHKDKSRKLKILFLSLSIFFSTLLFLLLIYESQALTLKQTEAQNNPKFVLPEQMVGLNNGT